MRPKVRLVVLLLAAVLGSANVAGKTQGVMVTADMRRNAMRNVERYDWARKRRDALAARVAPWLALSDERLWKLLPSQDMPRDSSVNRGDGCPNCGKEHYEAPYNPSRWHFDVMGEPWRIQCRNCEVWLPGNDFAAYYTSSLDQRHRFRRGRGDKRFLRSPDGRFVDDGTGIDLEGKKFFAAAFCAFQLWVKAIGVCEDLATLYTLTEGPRYAHKAGVLLDRMADLYPEMTFRPHYRLGMETSTGGTGNGRIQGMIWECFTAEKLSRAYDYVYDALIVDAELAAFASRMSGAHGTGDKTSPHAIAKHIEAHLLLEFVASIKTRQIWGNAGMHQVSMAVTAIALDRPGETEEYLDWLFAPTNQRPKPPLWDQPPSGGQIPRILMETLGREGLSDEVGLGYASIPMKSFVTVADLLRHYPRYTKRDIYRDFPKFRNGFSSGAAVQIAETYWPNWGDANKCGNGVGSAGRILSPTQLLSGYRAYRDPRIAREIWHATGGDLKRITGDIYEPSPQALVEEITRHASLPSGPLCSYNSGGYGLAALHAPSREQPRGIGVYYGRMAGHGHEDRLAISLVAHGIAMTPDMGYPLYTGTNPRRVGWVHHIVSHNTCMVNETGPKTVSWSGKVRLFAQAGPLHVADVDGDASIYEGLRTYRRCIVQVDIDAAESYFLDLFWVRGGRTHRLIQNGNGPDVLTHGLVLERQPGGTLAGPDVAYGAAYDGDLDDWNYAGTGFSFLKRPVRARPDGPFWVDWRMVDTWREHDDGWEAHLRIHTLSAVDEVALADGLPPAYKGNPPHLRYLHRVRRGDDLESQFVSVLDPYGATPNVTSARLLAQGGRDEGFSAAVEVTLAGGVRDLILVSEANGRLAVGDATVDGRVGLFRYAGKRLSQRVVVGEASAGEIAGWNDDDPTDIRLRLSSPLPPDASLVGRYIIVRNSERSDASYRIEAVHDRRTLGIGSQSLVERFVDPLDYGKGVVHTIAPGDPFIIATAELRPGPAAPGED